MQELTGFAPGAVAPFPPSQVDRVLIDNRLLLQEQLWVGAGSVNHMARLSPMELVRLSRAVDVDIAADL